MTASLFQIFRRIGPGQGRDFVVGDIHGAFHLLMKALDALKFDPAVDRLFSVGDLVDRGEYSEMALEFLSEPWVYAVRGNHEQMVLDLYASGKLDEEALAFHVKNNGMGWWPKTSPERQAALLAAFSRLPVAMEVETARGSVGMVHAEVPVGMDWPTFIGKLEDFDRHTIKSAIWGRTRATRNDTSGVAGIGRIFAGHTPQFEGARRLGNCYFIDTGAVFGAQGVAPGKLSVANMVCRTEVISARAPVVLPLVDLFTPEGLGPFGQYAKPCA
ncbi:hypothetical protein WJ96_05850 [Burkholderia ubonensis]|uniref:Serine/threonine specific protein phosphatases domain-containing protein n=1 Tax=Burkholderia ubonensis TaxID=101571 RepID=A0AAW3MU11_9BURK|nr:metallophosphoesterase [Burkholderia ubonensis]KVP98092.1 hypothetical protein WJ96_05850 [Burkholderia ubonensis]KVZ92789.1 hypothetical protein WL25_17510 [Burkholderia ubonensis]